MTPQQIAAWDISTLRRESAGFSDAAEASRGWVTRGDAVAQALSAAGAWDGPASEAARSALQAWLAVAATVHSALKRLADSVADAVGWYAQGQDVAATALRLAATAGVSVGADGVVSEPPAPTAPMDPEQAAAVAERHAAAVTVQAQIDEAFRLAARGDALVSADIGVFSTLAMAGFAAGSDYVDLMAALHVSLESATRLPEVPAGAEPPAVAAWWSALAMDAQLRLIRERPELIGGLDGVPAWARDQANRIALDTAVRELSAQAAAQQSSALFTPVNADLAFALAVQAALAQAEARGQPVQLYLFDVDAGRAAISIGDLDTADNVAAMVPGTAVDVIGDMSTQVARAEEVWVATGEAEDVAVLAWIGYDTPSYPEAIVTGSAYAGAPLLATAVSGLAARPGQPPRTTILAHSYGTVTTAAAAREPGDLEVDAVVLLGSPGTLGRADDFDIPAEQVFVGEGTDDWVANTAWHGIDPAWQWWYGGTCIAANMPEPEDSDHYHYFDPESEALHNMGLIVQGRYRSVVGCDD